ncbi:MAG: FAD-dependent oxidoreductase [Ferruginibacter sp.]
MPEEIVIIGNGIAGITCARHIRKQSNHTITVISSETPYFYSRTALMYIYMGHMKYEHTKPYEDGFWKKNRIQLVHDTVTKLDVENNSIALGSGKNISFDKLVLATGSVTNMPNIKGAGLPGVQGLYGMPDLLKMTTATSGIDEAVVAGGGLIGIEMAEMLLSRNIKVNFLIREKDYWNNILPPEEAAMISKHIRSHGINLMTGTEIKEILQGDDGRVAGILTMDGDIIGGKFVGLTIGVRPNVSLVQETPVEADRGILVNEHFETNVPGIYAIGDCVQHKKPPAGRKAVEQVWYTGRMHGEMLASTICGNRQAYHPDPWFNSAKFLDIEYQTYGVINATLQDDEDSFAWQHPCKNLLFRMSYSKKDNTVLGFNVLGLRLRHEVCNAWLKNKIKVDAALERLEEINFDPEFFRHYEKDIRSAFQATKKQFINT